MGKYCLECGKKLIGAQIKFCSPKHRMSYYRRNNKVRINTYFRDYMSKYRSKNKDNKYCAYCGLKLPKYKKRFCSNTHKNLFYKQDEMLHGEVLKQATILPNIPLYCDECGAPIVIDKNDVVCSKCGLVF
jgi:hypothetical protein